ncbi:hypothetical protein [Paenibacillus xylanexedens]|uniref:hypothetical protein n=1 Tax=Paenibacillus xylanexedens TaxID=528191 RepID=UPI000F52489D|nr:hypothetical protein [Paenibacillus xylanexedens]
MSREELVELLDENIKKCKKDHDVVVKMGSLGISPSYMSRYIKDFEKLRTYDNRQRGYEI